MDLLAEVAVAIGAATLVVLALVGIGAAGASGYVPAEHQRVIECAVLGFAFLFIAGLAGALS